MTPLPREREEKQSFSAPELLEVGRRVLQAEAGALLVGAEKLDIAMVKAAECIHQCRGRLVVSGLGKSGLVGRKIAATFASLGTPSFFLHAAEGSHGDLGMVCREDVGLFLSNGGETREVLELLPYFRRIGAPVIAMTGNLESRLARESDMALSCWVEQEADPLGLAPTSSTTLQLALGDALAGMVTELRGLRREDFALFHPGGTLGKRLLLRVEDIMGNKERLPIVWEKDSVKDALFSMTAKGYGATIVVDNSGKLVGIFTDGDLRRLVEDRGGEVFSLSVKDVMIRNPRTILPDKLAAEALLLMEQCEVSVLVVAEKESPVGMLHLHDVLKAGIA